MQFFLRFTHLTIACLNVFMVILNHGGVSIKTITVRLDDELHKQLKLKTVAEETTIQDILLKLIQEYLEKPAK